MQRLIRAATKSDVAAALAVHASSEVTSRQPRTGAPLARPDRILVEGFGATPGDVRPDSDLVAQANWSELRMAVELHRMTPDGLHHLGCGTANSGGKLPGTAAALALFTATANPVGPSWPARPRCRGGPDIPDASRKVARHRASSAGGVRPASSI